MQAAWGVIFAVVLLWSAIEPHDYPTWFLEVLPAIIGAGVLWFTRQRFPLTPLVYALILVHCCAHDSLTGSKRLNRLTGIVLSALNLFDFTDFQALHVLHHSHTNCPEKDPHYIRPGESWLHYVVTHYARLVAFTYTPYYRRTFAKREWEGIDLDSARVRRHDRINKLLICSGRKPQFGYQRILYSLVFGYLFWTAGLAWVLGGWSGLEVYAAIIIVPWAIAQVLVADFNWRGHVGLPERAEVDDYHGQDTRSLYGGVDFFCGAAGRLSHDLTRAAVGDLVVDAALGVFPLPAHEVLETFGHVVAPPTILCRSPDNRLSRISRMVG